MILRFLRQFVLCLALAATSIVVPLARAQCHQSAISGTIVRDSCDFGVSHVQVQWTIDIGGGAVTMLVYTAAGVYTRDFVLIPVPPGVLTGTSEFSLNAPPGVVARVVVTDGCYNGSPETAGIVDLVAPPWPQEIVCGPPEQPDDSTVRARVLTDAIPVSETKRAAAGNVNARLQLGGTLELALLESPFGAVLPSEFTVDHASVTQPLARHTLFSAAPVVRLGAAHGATATYKAVHEGSIDITVTPDRSSVRPVTVHLTVTEPSRLGSQENSWDSSIADVAHRTGISPQLVKGQIRQESDGGRFKPDIFRYEPCGADLNYITSNLNPAAQGPKIGSSPYSLYRAPDPRGPGLTADDLSPRNVYWIVDANSVRRKLVDADTNVSARELWHQNNITSYDRHGRPHGVRWDLRCRPSVLQRINDPNDTILDFVAQTPTASSYGLFQMMFDTAVQEWDGVDDPAVPGQKIKAPRFLFDTAANLRVGGGTMTIANQYMVKNYKTVNGRTTPSFTGTADFDSRWTRAYQRYNRYLPLYGQKVVDHSLEYLPIRSESVFY
jgi:hypothetical protein